MESKDNGVDVNVFVLWTGNHMNMQNKRLPAAVLNLI